jgi:hypothetical protein
MGLLHGRCILFGMRLGSRPRAGSGTRLGGVVRLACGLTFFHLFVVAGHGAKDIGVTPVEILRIACLKALVTAMLVNPGADCRMGIGGKGTI